MARSKMRDQHPERGRPNWGERVDPHPDKRIVHKTFRNKSGNIENRTGDWVGGEYRGSK